jgi:hypothetical protein
MEELVNKVAQSGLLTVDLEDYYPNGKRMQIDLALQLFMGQILKEKDFRLWIKNEDWTQYNNCYVAVNCSADAVIPIWAYMLVTAALQPYAKKVAMGNFENLETVVYTEIIQNLDVSEFEGKRVIVKGCGKLPVPDAAYVLISNKLLPVVQSLMFGEACSTVPLFKR